MTSHDTVFISDDFLPALQLGQTGDEDENIFNEITVEERRARIDSIIRYHTFL